MTWVLSLPLYVVIPFMWAGAMMRSNATYWAGRGASIGIGSLLRRSRTTQDRPDTTKPPSEKQRVLRGRAERLVNLLGPTAVAGAFLTIGLQSAIMLSAGAVRMPLRRFVPATVVGALAWGIIYGTAGMAALRAWMDALTGSWWGWLVLIGIIAGLVGLTRAADSVAEWVEGRRAVRRQASDFQRGEEAGLSGN